MKTRLSVNQLLDNALFMYIPLLASRKGICCHSSLPSQQSQTPSLTLYDGILTVNITN